MRKEKSSIINVIAGWKWCALTSIAIVILSLVPQINFWVVRGSDWKGAFSVLQGDELLYSAYVNALIDGRPRRTVPATSNDDAPLAESLFSIQFIPPYVIAFIARALGISTSSAFITLLAVEGLLASLSLCWLITSMTGDKRFAAIAVLIVLSFGALVGGQGLIGVILKPDVRFLGLPFLRRYEPGLPFPLCFVFCALVWKALTVSSRRAMILSALSAGVTIGVLVFSYFYLWTSALAWLVCITVLWPALRPFDTSKVVRIFFVASVPLCVALAFYVHLLAQLPSAVGKAWALTFTHGPDLLRLPEIVGAFVLGVLVIAVRRGQLQPRDPRVIFTASFGLLPFLVFNQQVVTGRSIQPFHYEVLITNYVVLIGLVMLGKLLNLVTSRSAFLLALLCVSWALLEVAIPSPILFANDVKLDQMVPVLRRVNELARTDGTWEGLRRGGTTPALVFSPEYGVSRLLPTWAPQGLLIGTSSASSQGVSDEERKERIYLHLYYCGKDESYLQELLNDRTDDPFLAYFVKSTLFGPERILLFLGWNSQPVSQVEIEREATEYAVFARSFSHFEVLKRPILYVITRTAAHSDLSRIDLWYERDNGERFGDYTLYRVKLRKLPDQ
jgi:hypothetical protein